MLAKKYRLSRNDEVMRVLRGGRMVRGEMVGIKFIKTQEHKNIKTKEQENESRIKNQELWEKETKDTHDSLFIIHNSRVTVVVSKKVFKRAVDRNRSKRLVRESVRLLWDRIKSGYDMVFLVQSGIAEKKQQEVGEEMKLLLKKAGLISN